MIDPSAKPIETSEPYPFIDCHCHLLPNVDDGSKSAGQTAEAFERLKRQGCIGCVLTPHMGSGESWFAGRDRIREAYYALQRNNPSIPLKLGSEVNVRSIDRTLDDLRSGALLTMAGTDIVLTEFEPYASFSFIINGVDELRKEGFTAVLAHPERLDAFRAHPENLTLLAEHGVSVQINAYSLVLEKHEDVREAARDALALRIVRYLGSDSHPPRRWPLILEGLRYIYESCKTDYADAVCFGNARSDFFSERIRTNNGKAGR